jgi:Flp pilus assembly protein TadG
VRGLGGDRAGAVFVEQLIVFLPTLFFVLVTYQLMDLFTANVLLRHAAFAAARAAIVVLPDDPARYSGVGVNQYAGARKTAVQRAAQLVLKTDPHFDPASIGVDVGKNNEDQLRATVTARYRCFASFVSIVCGGSSRELKGVGMDVYQGARYVY